MSAGLLKGLGAGLATAGDFMMRTKADELKEERLRKYQMEAEARQNERQDTMRAEDRQWQMEDKADDREFRKNEKVEDRTYQEGLLKKGWDREDSKEARELSRMETEAAYTDTAVEDGKKVKLFYNKAGKEIGRAEMGEATAPTKRQYLDPVTDAKLKAMNSEISSLQRADLSFDDTGKAERLQSLIRDRDALLSGGQSEPPPKTNIIPIGHEEDGYRFTGGNPNDPNAWVKIK